MRCAIIPPHILRNLAERHENPAVRRNVGRSLVLDQSHREGRTAALLVPPLQKAPATAKRAISDAKSAEKLPGDLIRGEGDGPTGDPAVDEAYEWLGITFDFYLSVFNRNSIDGSGFTMEATVHYGREYDNAFWDGERMVYGDGDGEVFLHLTKALDVTGHELTHGVTQYTANLLYEGQSGAINESMSDVFGSLIKQYHHKETADKADWLIGEGIFAPAVSGVALRSMKEPGKAYDDDVLGKDPQPATMADYVETDADNGGVHINSGIPNRAFYLTAIALGGHSWEKAGRIWYETLMSKNLSRTTDFSTFARATLTQARRLYGESSGEESAVRDAWDGVGLTV